MEGFFRKLGAGGVVARMGGECEFMRREKRFNCARLGLRKMRSLSARNTFAVAFCSCDLARLSLPTCYLCRTAYLGKWSPGSRVIVRTEPSHDQFINPGKREP